MSSAPCLAGVFSLCFFLFVTIWVTSLGSILRSCYFAEFSITQCFRGPQMVRCASAFKPAPARAHSSGTNGAAAGARKSTSGCILDTKLAPDNERNKNYREFLEG